MTCLVSWVSLLWTSLGKSLPKKIVEIADESYSFVNVGNDPARELRGDHSVKYLDVTSEIEGKTMALRISGHRDARIKSSMLILRNKDSSYSI